MQTQSNKHKNLQAWVLFALGVMLFVLNPLLGRAYPESLFNSNLIPAFGILAVGMSVPGLVRSLTTRWNPAAARRMDIEENDERLQAIRHQAGHAAFVFAFLLNASVLIAYSAATRGQPGFDPLWWALTALVIAPPLFFMVVQARLGRS